MLFGAEPTATTNLVSPRPFMLFSAGYCVLSFLYPRTIVPSFPARSAPIIKTLAALVPPSAKSFCSPNTNIESEFGALTSWSNPNTKALLSTTTVLDPP